MGARFRDLAGPVGLLPTGPRNAITDVPGVLVGHSQAGSGELTGVTVVAPPRLPARAGVATVNGVGELTKKLEIDEWGIIQTAVYLCGTHALGMVYHGAVLAEGGDPSNTLIPVVGECDDSDLADARTVTTEDVDRARAALGADVPEGSVGGGTGMTCFAVAAGGLMHRGLRLRRAHDGAAAAAAGAAPAPGPGACRLLRPQRLRRDRDRLHHRT